MTNYCHIKVPTMFFYKTKQFFYKSEFLTDSKMTI